MRFIEPVSRPPMEANSMLLQVMQSCNWNKCNFCYRLRDYPLLIATPEELAEEIKRQNPYYSSNTDIFFVGSNAFAIPARILRQYLEIIRVELPHAGRISMFSRVDAIAARSDEELAELKALGLTRLYVGTENGNEEALKLMNKGHTAEEAIRQLKRLDAAGLEYTLFYIIGMGGKGTGEACGMATAKLFNAVNPKRIVSTGMTVTEGRGAAQMLAKGKYQEASEREKIEELRTFLKNLEVDTLHDGIHMLNPLHYRFQNSDKKAKEAALREIDGILENYSDEEMEKAINRQAMAEASKPRLLVQPEQKGR